MPIPPAEAFGGGGVSRTNSSTPIAKVNDIKLIVQLGFLLLSGRRCTTYYLIIKNAFIVASLEKSYV
jgi:hypothetical protein